MPFKYCLHFIVLIPALVGGQLFAQSPTMIEYLGRISVSGEPFAGSGQFKFALIDQSGKRVWTNSDNVAPIEAGMPTGSIPITATRGMYWTRLGDTAAGMKSLAPELVANWKNFQIEIWFNDGNHGWANAGVTALTKGKSPTLQVGAGLAAGTQDEMLQKILIEVRRLRSEVGLLHKQLGSGSGATARPSSKPIPPKPTPKVKSKPVKVSLADAPRHSLGSAKAPVVLVEFSDFECGYCKRFFDKTLPQLKEKYIDTGKLRLVSRNFPIRSHPQAGPAAHALLSAADQDPKQYWAMRAWLFGHNRELSDVIYGKYVKDAGLDVPRFLTDYTARRHGAELNADIAAGRSVGITGTPSFVLGTSDGTTIDGERIAGAKSFEYFESKIISLLEKQAGDSPALPQKPDNAAPPK
jgi:protein-disulfide isomerase